MAWASAGAARDLAEEVDFAIGLERKEFTVVVDIPVDRHGRIVEQPVELRISCVERSDQLRNPRRFDLDLGVAANQVALCV